MRNHGRSSETRALIPVRDAHAPGTASHFDDDSPTLVDRIWMPVNGCLRKCGKKVSDCGDNLMKVLAVFLVVFLVAF